MVAAALTACCGEYVPVDTFVEAEDPVALTEEQEAAWDGVSKNKALLKEIPHHIALAAGDTVYTSGYSSIFPADIPLGTAGEAKIVNGATYEIQVTLLEDLESLRYAIIVGNLGNGEITKLENRE